MLYSGALCVAPYNARWCGRDDSRSARTAGKPAEFLAGERGWHQRDRLAGPHDAEPLVRADRPHEPPRSADELTCVTAAQLGPR